MDPDIYIDSVEDRGMGSDGPVRIANRDATHSVLRKEAFTGSNLYARWRDGMYVVFSYGPHFPLLVWNEDQWFHNEAKYSQPTSKHMSQCGGTRGQGMNTEQLQEIIRCRSVSKAVALRMGDDPPYILKAIDTAIAKQDMAYDFKAPRFTPSPTQEIPA